MFYNPLTISLIITVISLLGIIFWVFFLRKPLFLIILILLVFVTNVILEQEMISFEIGNFNINILDILSVFLLTNAIGRIIVTPKKIHVEFFVILLLGALLFISWLRGTFAYGLENSTNSFRTYLYFYSVLFYTCTLEYSIILSEKVFSWIKITAFFIIIIAIIRWVLVAFNEVSSTAWIAPNGSMVRVLYASAAFILLQLLFILTYSRKLKENHVFYTIVILAIICMILVLQQRTVWVALIISFFVLLLIKSKIKKFVLLGVLLCVVVIAFLLVINNFSIEDLSGTAIDFRNLNWRIVGWQALLTPERFTSPLELLIGQPFGSGYGRYILNSVYETTVSPHNFYVQTLLNIGSIGLILLVLLYGIIFFHLLNTQQNRTSLLFILLLTSQLVFYLTYAPSFEQGLILGLAVLFIRNANNQLKYSNDFTQSLMIDKKTSQKFILTSPSNES